MPQTLERGVDSTTGQLPLIGDVASRRSSPEFQDTFAHCLFCGREYYVPGRREAVAHIAQPNSAVAYCTDEHWMSGTN